MCVYVCIYILVFSKIIMYSFVSSIGKKFSVCIVLGGEW